MINVFFPYYTCGNAARQQEIDLCLEKNISNSAIDKLFVLIDDKTSFSSSNSKVEVVYLDQRPTYSKWLQLTASMKLEGVSVLCNSDIYFDSSIVGLSDVLGVERSFVALSRWELLGNEISLHKNPHWSQDVWAVRCGEEYSRELLHSLNFPMGVPRCDNKIAYIFAIQGWRVINPCQFIKSIHVHETQLRGYDKQLDSRIIGGVCYVHPGAEICSDGQLELDVWTLRSAQIGSVRLNRRLEEWAVSDSQSSGGDDVLNVSTPAEAEGLNFRTPTATEVLAAQKFGKCIYSNEIAFRVYLYDSAFYFVNRYELCRHVVLELDGGLSASDLSPELLVQGLIPAVLTTHLHKIRERPLNKEDINFWQYPCSTEQQALSNHLALSESIDVDWRNREVNLYVGLPWATYIDKKSFPKNHIDRLSKIVEQYRKLSKAADVTLRVHTVCQHIHWVRILEVARTLGITDIHLSHKDSKSLAVQREEGYSFNLHGWPLIAVNYVVQERSRGLEFRTPERKNLLASFIGANMPHYRSDIRIKLLEAARKCDRADVLVDLGTEWHFNKAVYDEQVLSKTVDPKDKLAEADKTASYNRVISDSKFSLCPEGAGPNTLRFWESIAIGAIPVLFSDDLSILNESPDGVELLKNCIVWTEKDVESLFVALSEFSDEYIGSAQVKLSTLYKKFERKTCFGFNS
ncbi:exostosin family protein [Microbulbifer sp. YPW1]|uniref:exostosin domain-containing protein n=1 Tax=Microbulbifer sp. YPW1 TaxID=2745199 RepID=UPI00159A2705|nr:exostosin family protein [Microbulbifer sp. YPW1]QKX18087.1 exostosin family protein [Microbulbifer sp. YPW1]